jgi:fibronectin-binding autotransporter adhesin
VDGGVLLVQGNLSGSTVNVSLAELGGIGTVGNVTVTSGVIAPGASAGTLSTGAMTLDSTSIWRFELATPGVVGSGVNDLLAINGSLTLDGVLQVDALAGFVAGTYRLANYTGALTNNIMSIDSDFLLTHPGSTIDTATVGEINLVVIPEPGSALLMLGGLGLAASLRRRRAV